MKTLKRLVTVIIFIPYFILATVGSIIYWIMTGEDMLVKWVDTLVDWYKR